MTLEENEGGVMNPFDEGYQANLDGQDIGDNPYEKGSREFDDWFDGFDTAEEEVAK